MRHALLANALARSVGVRNGDRAAFVQQREGPESHRLGISRCLLSSGAVSIEGAHADPRPHAESVVDALHACSTRPAQEALHPLRRGTPVTS